MLKNMERERSIRELEQKSIGELEVELKTIKKENYRQSLIKKIKTYYDKISNEQSQGQKEIMQNNCDHFYGDGFLRTLFIGDYTGYCLKCGKLQDPLGN